MSGVPGQTKRAPMHNEQARSRMWQSMRILRHFTVADLQAAGEVTRSHATKYVRALLTAGYLQVTQPKRNGTPGGHTHYRLVRDSGPYAPRVGKQAVRDPNVEPVCAEKRVDIPESEYRRALRCIAYAQQRAAAGDEAAVEALQVAS